MDIRKIFSSYQMPKAKAGDAWEFAVVPGTFVLLATSAIENLARFLRRMQAEIVKGIIREGTLAYEEYLRHEECLRRLKELLSLSDTIQ